MKNSKEEQYLNVKFFKDGKFINTSLIKEKGIWKTEKAKSSAPSRYYCIPAMVDMRAYLGEPGNQLAETLVSFAQSATAGGFQTVMVHGNDLKMITTREDVDYIKSTKNVKLIPVPSVRKNLETEDMTGLYDMHEAGVNYFSMAGEKSSSSGFMQRTQQYIANFDAGIITTAYDANFRKGAMVAESDFTTSLGFNGAPKLTEISMVQRDLAIAAYNCAKIHFSGITCKESVALISAARKKGVEATCDVSIFSLCFCDEDLGDFDANLKLRPFLRTKEDQKALLKGLQNGEIDAIASYHYPQMVEYKQCEFSYASFGAISFQTFISMALKHVIPAIGWEKFIATTAINPAKIAGAALDKMILIDTEEEWTLTDKTNLSLSKNSPVYGQKLKGRVIELI